MILWPQPDEPCPSNLTIVGQGISKNKSRECSSSLKGSPKKTHKRGGVFSPISSITLSDWFRVVNVGWNGMVSRIHFGSRITSGRDAGRAKSLLRMIKNGLQEDRVWQGSGRLVV